MSIPTRLFLVAVSGAAISLLACKVYDPLYCDEKTECTDPARPFCDLHGDYPASEGIGRTCIPDPNAGTDAGGSSDAGPGAPDASFCTGGEFVQCTDSDTAIYCNEQGSEYVTVECGSDCDPGREGCYCEPETSSCSDNQTVHCGSDGQVVEIETCALGCNDSGERCVDVNPSNGLAGFLDMTDEAPVVMLSNGAVIDTDTGTIEDGDGTLIDVPDFQVTAPAGGVPIRVFAVKSIIFGDTTIDGSRAVAIVADSDIRIRGHVRVLAGEMTMGGCIGGDQECIVDTFPSICSGGGGGGFGSAGADGGDGAGGGSFNVTGGAGGSTSGSASLTPLRGGCAGGSIGPLYEGGHGGGAVQLVSRTRIVLEDSSVQSSLNVGGKGGGTTAQGGGSGGGILLEAPKVTSAGAAIVANGGGGGCLEAAGEDGQPGSNSADGGSNPAPNAFDGGDGASTLNPTPDVGEVATCIGGCFAGGGGGGMGRIHVKVPSEIDFSNSGAVSPAASIGTLATR